MIRSLAARLAIALAVGLALFASSEASAQQTLPTDPTHPVGPEEPIGPAPSEPGPSVERIPTANLDATHIQRALRRQGYYDIHGVQRDGSRYRATAQKDGRTVELEIDARTGVVSPRGM